MRGKSVSAGDTVVEFDLPDSDKFLSGKSDAMTARLIVYDNQARSARARSPRTRSSRSRRRKRPCRSCSSAAPPSAGGVVLLLSHRVHRARRREEARRDGCSASARDRGRSGPRPCADADGLPWARALRCPWPARRWIRGWATAPRQPMGATRAVLSGGPGIFTSCPAWRCARGATARSARSCSTSHASPAITPREVRGGQLLVFDDGTRTTAPSSTGSACPRRCGPRSRTERSCASGRPSSRAARVGRAARNLGDPSSGRGVCFASSSLKRAIRAAIRTSRSTKTRAAIRREQVRSPARAVRRHGRTPRRQGGEPPRHHHHLRGDGSARRGTPPGQALKAAIEEAARRVYTLGGPPENRARPGSTVVAMLLHDGGADVAHVGDSRSYIIRSNQIYPLTRDHSMVQG
jgi:hypothetical protein